MHGAVLDLYHALMPLGEQYGFLVSSPKVFGLEIDIFDPQTGTLFSAVRPARRDGGPPAVMMTAVEVLATVLSARRHNFMQRT